MNNKPLVSVIMPAYNAQKYIEQAVTSVINQTYRNWQLIVIDDCSKDNTLDIVQKLAKKDDRITVVENAENLGVARTRNKGFDVAEGSWVALLDSDDLWHSDKLEKQLNAAQHTGADIVYCSYGMIDESGEKILDDFIVPEKTDFEASLAVSVMSCSTVMLSREIYKTHRFSTDFYHEDLVYWLEILREGYKASGVTEVLAQYRVSQGSRASNKFKSAYNRWRIFRKHLKLPLNKSIKYILKYTFAGLKKYTGRQR